MMNSTFDSRTIFRELGANPVDVELATQHSFYKPTTSRPSMASTQAAVRSIQLGLQSLGCVVKVNGQLDPLTTMCLQDAIGLDWPNKTWAEIGKKLIGLKAAGKSFAMNEPVEALSGVSFGQQAGGLLLIGAALYIAFKIRSPLSK